MAEETGITAFLKPAELHKLGRLVLLSRYVVEGNLAGAHRSPLKGASSEFADHKAYTRGDDLKHLDWKVLARTDRHYIKRFEDETNLRVYLCLDRSASMGYGADGITKYEYACHLAAAIGYVVVKMRDSIGLFLHSDRVDVQMEAANSLNHLNNALKRVQEKPPASSTQVADVLHQVAETVRKRALIVVISDLFDDPDRVNLALAHFRKQHHDVIVFHVLDPTEIDLPFKHGCEFIDMETGERIAADPRALAADYQRVFSEFLEKYRKACQAMNIDYRIVRTDTPCEDFIRAYLEERRKLSK
jgi:uncharacterized protein (DUF58 family)